ncbi:proteasome subunit beta type-6, putative [Plasmodium berghei]|uniref:Proteasome subunit beta type-6, putative n=2 Tax=Plasmodium berghei TaxID=5821 RepID=A0A509AJG6_PLABA|nr:proteasome subunit beta type-6, putative [Plasmodium berghei ANKA]CXI36486.1 proteasome subunit beta type-6, putative [Plasmodium berghei]SCM21597.1 proteasome subunit beta type-6, putative [Plasmodium berghei]SCN24798.1 proteasome subunit beta type-6, putative [Plasmodium berghei]SCO59924.1 proteasome subunit beta type-6, putative [Plasmodium berghei]SCO61277.1 proteasome subunit beta type-6, putative [Plasmodium berghei]|eukprot:XP_034421300.1 proteasome subunit beta type-6, putative [Plasmodium berghei ANKA]
MEIEPMKIYNINQDSINNEYNIRTPISDGTTIIGIIYEHGVMLACDTRTSSGTFVSNKCSRKINRINENIYVCRSGASAHSQKVIEVIKHYCASMKSENRKKGRFHENEVITDDINDEEIDIDQINNINNNNVIAKNKYYYNDKFMDYNPLVENVAYITKKLIYANNNFLSCGLIFGGYDKIKKQQLYSVNLNGSIIQKYDYAVSGSGSIYIQSYLQDKYKKNMTKKECFDLILNCVKYAIYNDNSSGGIVRILNITKNFVEEYTITNTQIHFDY